MELSKYLARYKNLEPPQTSTIKLFIQTIRDECGITLTEKEVALSRGGVIVSCHPAVRSELLQCAPQVLTTLHKKYKVRLSYIR